MSDRSHQMLPSCLRRAFLAAAIPIHLKGIAGPGAPHVFKFQRRSDCCYWDCLFVECWCIWFVGLLFYFVLIVALLFYFVTGLLNPQNLSKSKHILAKVWKTEVCRLTGSKTTFPTATRSTWGRWRDSSDARLILNMACRQLFGTQGKPQFEENFWTSFECLVELCSLKASMPRTKRWMADVSFQNPMLYYPQQWALELLPLGVPAGVMVVEIFELNWWIFLLRVSRF